MIINFTNRYNRQLNPMDSLPYTKGCWGQVGNGKLISFIVSTYAKASVRKIGSGLLATP